MAGSILNFTNSTRSSPTSAGMRDNDDESTTIHSGSSARSALESKKYATLQSIMTNFCNDSQPILSYYTDPEGDEVEKSEEHYSDYDFQSLASRDFRTRIFFSDYAINGNNAWVRTHHTDCGIRPDIDYVREYYEASFDAENHSAAKAALTGIMDSIFCMDTRQYYNFATVLASCLSHDAANVAFEGSVVSDNDKFSSNDPASRISKSMNQRRRFLLLLDIIFEEILSKRFLDDNCNIFRLVHAEIKGNRNKTR